MTLHQIVIVGGGAAGIATAASLLKRRKGLDIAIIEPSEDHFYQPGWTMVGGGVFQAPTTRRSTASVMPAGVTHIKGAAASFQPEENQVALSDGRSVTYHMLIVATGIAPAWDAIPGLEQALGKNGVTSNYRFDLAPYTYKLAQNLKSGRAIFTQPPMPIKCPGAPQKAMYLSCSLWEKAGALGNIDVQFHNAGPALFGVKDYVPPLMDYIKRYNAHLNFGSKLIAVDGPNQKATFAQTGADGTTQEVTLEYDMLHVTPPQRAVDAVAKSPLADATGFVEVNAKTLQHTRFSNIFGIGDGCNTPNSKTAAAARKQAPIVAVNLLSVMDGAPATHAYDGYGSCPLTVEHGRAIVAEFGYGGKLLPSFPWDSTKPRWLGWQLKANFLPWLYWNAMLKGREWLAAPLERHTD
ncbi:NAD(P)/FAD-dependent oxidoreductase [Pseudorhodobacter sp. E13]|uniref:NAD(P)/FAD-dependent oxidoreductase n=1 Tax=Pseudorhodobacter sp. E13 TaxID=2487931 RepID=UPI000F8CC185|nr:FAD/NAD(P)-binding oxidoreductase [Pseudorhodobacter sp. E13]RUS58513.1 NAD(P)/FAD-dependent oxidoreductase [Pseudorhodobacter sp. E13]